MFDQRQRAELVLLGVAISWGLTFPLIKVAVESLSPGWFVLIRFSLAALAFVPLILFSKSSRTAMRALIIPASILGFFAWVSYTTQTVGLQTTGAGRAAFITGTNVLMVPLLSPLFRAGRPGWNDLVAALIALAGLWVLCDPAGGGINRGDWWVLLCAFSYANYLLYLQRVLESKPDPLALAALQVGAVALFALFYMPVDGGEAVAPNAAAWVALLFCALVATVGTFWLQSRFQGATTAARVALLFALEPVFAMVFAWFLLDEVIGVNGLTGAGLILVAVIFSEWWQSRQMTQSNGSSSGT